MKGKRKQKGLQGRRFTAAQKKDALKLIVSGMTREAVAESVGTTPESLRRWVKEARATGAMPAPPRAAVAATVKPEVPEVAAASASASGKPRSPYAPADPAEGLSPAEVAVILEWKRKHLSMGPAQLRAQIKRFHGWRLSLKAIARVLRGHGYELVHRGKRPKGEVVQRFEAPRRNALWQMDFTEVRVGEARLHVLIMVDDFSRYAVGYALCDSPSSDVVTATFRAAMARHGKPEAVRSDRGGGFTAFAKEGDFGRVLEAELVDHIVGRAYNPKGGGKVESAVGTLKRELWELKHLEDRVDAEQQLARFFAEYNEGRAHMGIDGLTPADRFFGRADHVLACIDAISRRRQGAAALVVPPGGPIEELLEARTGSPFEVLRLVIVDGVMELRFCGARVVLGRIES